MNVQLKITFVFVFVFDVIWTHTPENYDRTKKADKGYYFSPLSKFI